MDLIGQRIGSYVVERELGSGGTGTVYRCKHTLIDRDVAVKVLHDEQARDPDQVARFFQEAKAAADIGHPNIIVIIDFGTLHTPHGDRAYLMMEALDGVSLDKRIRQGGLALEEIHHVMTQCCSALAASHAKGIVHRDLKPGNIYLCRRTFDPIFVKVLDFGIAKLVAPAPGMHKTQYGMVLGTPAYMSPEQCEGKGAVDHRSDIYSLGCVLYEMLTGTLPHQGEIRDMLLGHLYAPVEPPRARNPSIPPEWEALCLHMMEKAREARPQSMIEVGFALDHLRAHADAYRAAEAARATSPRSGHTAILPGLADEPAAARETLHVASPSLAWTATSPPTPMPMPAPVPMATPTPMAIPTPAPMATPIPTAMPTPTPTATPMPTTTPTRPAEVCASLVNDPRHAGFLATLLTRPPGRWWSVHELCETSQTATPPTLPAPPLFVAWLDHPYLDPGLCVVAFLSPRDGGHTTVVAARRRW